MWYRHTLSRKLQGTETDDFRNYTSFAASKDKRKIEDVVSVRAYRIELHFFPRNPEQTTKKSFIDFEKFRN